MVLGGLDELWVGGQTCQQGASVHGGGQPPGVRGFGQGRAGGVLPTSSLRWGLAAGRPDILVVAAEGLVKVVQEGKMVGLSACGAVGRHTQADIGGGGQKEGAWGGQGDNDLLCGGDQDKRAATAIGCDVNKWLSCLCFLKN